MNKTVKMGDKGDDVRALQLLLNYVPTDGDFTEAFEAYVKVFQESHQLTVDGVIGEATKQVILSALPTVSTSRNRKSIYAKVVQLLVGCDADGIFGIKTKTAVTAFQTANSLTPDGIVGKNTWRVLLGAAEEVISSGENIQPPNFKQYDKRWASVMYSNHGDKSQTMKSSACGPTSMTDIVAQWWDKSALPTDLAKKALDWGCRTNNSGTTGSFFKKCADFYKASKYVSTSSIETAISCLKAGGYVVVCFGKSKWTNGGHYCCMWKYDGKHFYINDPASSSSSRAKGTYSEVKSARKGFYCFWR